MTTLEQLFLEAYYKACETSKPEDWFDAALLAKQMYNDSRDTVEGREEFEIRMRAKKLYGKGK